MKLIKSVCIAMVGFCLALTNVHADSYYTNKNGITFTHEEYEFVTNLYWDGYQEEITNELYNIIFLEGLIGEIETKSQNYIIPYGTTHSTPNKSIKISKVSQNNSTLLTVTVEWINSPVIRSYDVIGAYLSGVTLSGSPISMLTSTNGSYTSSDIKQMATGFGVSIKLPDTGSNIKINQTFRVTGSGRVYASYQHAKSPVTQANSKKYTISTSGYGNVFLFEASVKDSYDQMGGVDIAI